MAKTLQAKLTALIHKHYRGAPPKKQAVLTFFGIYIVLVVFVQLIYPGGYGVPTPLKTRIHTTLKSEAEIKNTLESLNQTPLNIAVEDKSYQTTASQIGVTVDSAATSHSITDYPWYERLVPGSILFTNLALEHKTVLKVDEAKLNQFAQQIVQENNRAAQDSRLEVQNGRLVVVEARPGLLLDAKDVKQQLLKLDPTTNAGITISGSQTQPSRRMADLAAPARQAQAILDLNIRLNGLVKSQLINPSSLGSFISFNEEPTSGELQVGIKRSAIEAYLKIYAEDGINLTAKPTVVTLYDDVEAAREVGQDGRGIDVAVTTDRLTSLLEARRSGVVEVPTVTVVSTIEYKRTYSPSRLLQNRLAEIAPRMRGRWSIAVVELAGANRSASYSGSERFVTASTYKLFVAYLILEKVEAGRLSNYSVLGNGVSVSECLNDMIIYSDNACAIALAQNIGWDSIDATLHTRGFSSTDLDNYNAYGGLAGDKKSTANDEAELLRRLYTGVLLGPSSTAYLLDLMSRQVYRAGIPSGVPGLRVADKVGFLEGYLHDAAIVYAAERPYVLIVLTQSSSWSEIAQATREVHAYLQQP